MPVFLDEQMIGIDSDVIGFPHLLVCMGFVVRSDSGAGRESLSGIHLTKSDESQRTFPFFVQELANSGTSAKILDIFGTCNRLVRYGSNSPDAAWRQEMTEFAEALKFKGAAHGFDTSIIAPRDGTYVQYELHTTGRPFRIFYKRNEKMTYGGEGIGLPVVRFGREGAPPEELADNPKVRALYQDRVEISIGSRGWARPSKKKWSSKPRTLSEVDYSLRLETRYVYW